jgi:hypothetical protein
MKYLVTNKTETQFLVIENTSRSVLFRVTTNKEEATHFLSKLEAENALTGSPQRFSFKVTSV